MSDPDRHIHIDELTKEWGLESSLVQLAGSRSGAEVFRTRSTGGTEVVLKVTWGGSLQQAARRELEFYLTLAERVPVLTPTLLRHFDNDDVTVLLLSAHRPAPPARQWHSDSWLRVAHELAALHSMPIADRGHWTSSSWLNETMAARPDERLQRFWSTTAAASEAAYLFKQTHAFIDTITVLPDVVVHGDNHVDNLLLEGDRFVWSDWQATTFGNPANDLAFLWMRANSDGADVPYSRMVEAYLQQAAASAAYGDAFRRSLIAIEVGIVLFGWPSYANLHPQDEQDRVHARLIDLARQWCG